MIEKRIRLLIVSSDNDLSSGAFISMSTLCLYLKKNHNVDVTVLLPKKGDGVLLLDEYQIPYKIIRSYDWLIPLEFKDALKTKIMFLTKKFLNLFSINKIKKEIKENDYDLIHINTIYSYVGAIAAKALNKPLVWHLREIIDEGNNRTFIEEDFSRRVLSYANRYIAISNCVKEYYQNRIDVSKCDVIYNGIDVNRFYQKDKQIFHDKNIKILFVGELTQIKGAYTVLEALENLNDKNAEISFVGREKEEFNHRVNQSSIRGNIHLCGFQKNVEDYYRNADIVITGSKMEAFGRTTAEAMLSGCLTITTNSYGSKELVKDKETGLSYEYSNSLELEKCLSYALKHKEEMKKVAKKGQEFILNNMTAEINAKRVYQEYHTLLK